MSFRPYEDQRTLIPITPRPTGLTPKGAKLYYDNERVQQLLSDLEQQGNQPIKELSSEKRQSFSQLQDLIRHHYGGELFEHLQKEIQRVFPGEPGDGETVRDLLLEYTSCNQSSCKDSVLVANWSPEHGYVFATLLTGRGTGAIVYLQQIKGREGPNELSHSEKDTMNRMGIESVTLIRGGEMLTKQTKLSELPTRHDLIRQDNNFLDWWPIILGLLILIGVAVAIWLIIRQRGY